MLYRGKAAATAMACMARALAGIGGGASAVPPRTLRPCCACSAVVISFPMVGNGKV